VVRDALKVIEDTAAPRVESGKKEQEGEKHAAQAAEQFSEHDCEKLNIGIAKIFRPHGNIPRPSLDQAVVPPTWDATSLFDICETASMAYEISSSGMNGLRYASFEHDVSELSGLHVVSTEVCSASEEDVSSIIKYASSDGLSDTNIMKAYWFVRTFSSCAVVASGLLATLVAVRGKSRTSVHLPSSGISLSLTSARLQGFEVCAMIDARNEVDGMPLNKRSHNKPMERISHVVVLMTDGGGTDYVVDLAGSQFGIFGHDARRPQVVVEDVQTWKKHFLVCVEEPPVIRSELLGDKIDLLTQVAKWIVKAGLH
jgi:hypothetical protein